MQRVRLLAILGILAVLTVTLSGAPALAITPSFTITATNVTMSTASSSGIGSSSFTLASINGYAGTVGVTCSAPTPPAGVNVPICDWSPGPIVRPTITLVANQVATGTISFINAIPPCNPCPVSLPRSRSHCLPQGLALAGALLLGFGFRRRAPSWLTLTLFAIGTFAGLAAINACGGNNDAATPGTYVYTIYATDVSTDVSVTTSINVTVP